MNLIPTARETHLKRKPRDALTLSAEHFVGALHLCQLPLLRFFPSCEPELALSSLYSMLYRTYIPSWFMPGPLSELGMGTVSISLSHRQIWLLAEARERNGAASQVSVPP
jgi:hypothetical protein